MSDQNELRRRQKHDRKGQINRGSEQESAVVDNWQSRLPNRNEMHLKRKVFHVFNGLLYTSIFWFCDRTLAVLFFAPLIIGCVFLELGRLNFPLIANIVYTFLGAFMRAHEVHRPSGICYYVLGILIAIMTFDKGVTILAMLYLSVGDPFASAVGILVTNHITKIFTLSTNRKNLIGSLACWLLCSTVTWLFVNSIRTSALKPFWSEEKLIQLCVVGGAAAAISELSMIGTFVQRYLDDNLLIPVVSGLVVQLSVNHLGIRLSESPLLAARFHVTDAITLVDDYAPSISPLLSSLLNQIPQF